jgi:diguanylate cyclase
MHGASPLAALIAKLWSPAPEAIRDDLARLRYTSLQSQVPLLYAMTIMIVAITMLVAHPDAGFLIRIALPGIIICACTIRLSWWLRQRWVTPDAATAVRRIKAMTVIASMIAAACSTWTAIGWMASVPGERSYYPMFMVIGLLSATFCMSTIRGTAVILLTAGLVPTLSLLVIFGSPVDRTAAALVTLSAIFLARLVAQRHNQLVMLLLLQQQMGELAATDPLTGLANRRRLLERLGQALTLGKRPALLLLDLDGFKPINDRHGHAVGDDLLCAVAQRLQASADEGDLVCRLGGDEFAVLLAAADARRARATADRLLASFLDPVAVRDLRLRVGASLGFVVAARGETDPHALIAAADNRLYAAKAQGRGKADDTAAAIKPTGTRG